MNDLYFFKLYIFNTITCCYSNTKDILKLNKLNIIRIIKNIVSYTKFLRDIYSDISRSSTIDITYQYNVVLVL